MSLGIGLRATREPMAGGGWRVSIMGSPDFGRLSRAFKAAEEPQAKAYALALNELMREAFKRGARSVTGESE